VGALGKLVWREELKQSAVTSAYSAAVVAEVWGIHSHRALDPALAGLPWFLIA
jgi:hypothetical protein